jgi:hypothetical protein
MTMKTVSMNSPSRPSGKRSFLHACGLSLMLAVLPATATAQPVIDLSRTQADGFYAPAGGSSNAQSIVLTNTGVDPLVIGAVTLFGSDAAKFRVSGACANGNVTLDPGQQCLFDIVFTAATADTSAILLIDSNAPGGPVPVLLVGRLAETDPLTPYAFATFVPPYVDFGVRAVGAPAAATTITLTSAGRSRVFTIADVQVGGRDPQDFTVAMTCPIGTSLTLGISCTFFVQFAPTAVGPRSAEIYVSEPTLELPFPIALTGVGGASTVPIVDVVEYYNASLDHYFVTWVKGEQDNLDAGNTPTKWQRTGQVFKAYSKPYALASAVCRYYLPPQFGDSHFFGRSAAECTATGQQHPGFVLEDPAFMFLFLPVAGVCPTDTTPVYRVYSNRPDANHRYMTQRSIRDFMISKGWLAEGDGPDLVVMCAPQ